MEGHTQFSNICQHCGHIGKDIVFRGVHGFRYVLEVLEHVLVDLGERALHTEYMKDKEFCIHPAQGVEKRDIPGPC